MKILLLNPPVSVKDMNKTSYLPNFFQSIMGNFPPIGLVSLAPLLELNGHEVDVLDAHNLHYTYKQIGSIIQKNKYEIIGLTGYTHFWNAIKEISIKIKLQFPHIRLLFGGGHARFWQKETLLYSPIDFVIEAEGEITLVELINCLQMKGDLHQVRGIYFREEEKIVYTGKRELLPHLDDLPIPAWEKLPVHIYSGLLIDKRNYLTTLTYRGCPYLCSFCSATSRMGRAVRARSPIKVIEELIFMKEKLDVRYVTFFDETFTADKDRAKKICRLMIEYKLNLHWDCRSRADGMDEELVDLMKRSGCRIVKMGIEVASDYIRNDVLKKGITNQQIEYTCKITKKSGIERVGFFMLGCPQETETDLIATINYAKQLDLDIAMFHLVFLVDPYCEMYKWAKEKGYIDDACIYNYFEGLTEKNFQYLQTPDLPLRVRQKYLNQAYRSFYFRPMYILKRVFKTRNINILINHIIMGVVMSIDFFIPGQAKGHKSLRKR